MSKLLSFLVILLLTPFVYAADFSVQLTPSQQNVCPSQHTSYKLVVKNEGSQKELYEISVSESVRNWTKILPNTFGLESGQSTEVTIFIQPHYTSKSQLLDFSIDTESGDKTISLKAKLNVLGCRGVELSAQPINACDGSFVTGFVNVKNTGSINDTYTLSTDQAWAVLENTTVQIKPNETQQIKFNFAKIPLGENRVKVNAQSSSYAKASLDVIVNLEKCFDLTTKSQSVPELCPGESSEVNIDIQNTGTKQDVYNVYTKDLIVQMDNTTLYVPSGETMTVTANVNIPKTARSDQVFTLYIEGNTKKEHKQDIKVIPFETCYAFTTAVDERDILVKQSENTFTSILIRNNGRLPLNLTINSDIEWVDPSTRSLNLAKDDSKEVYIYVAPTYETKDGRYTATISVNSDSSNKTEKLDITVGQDIETVRPNPQETPQENTTETTNETGPVVDTTKLGKPVQSILKFIFSPILGLFR